MGRLLIGGVMLLVFGLLIFIRGAAEGDWSKAGVGVPGLLIGIASLIYFMLDRKGRIPK